MKKIVAIIVVIFLTDAFSFGQGGTAGQDAERERVYQESIRRTRDQEARNTDKPRSNIPKINNTLSKDDRAKLQPRDEDTAQHSNFLKQSKTGIFKIFPFLNCDRRVIDVNDEKCLNSIQALGNGSVYSFTKDSNLIGTWGEIVLLQDSSFKIYPSSGLLGIIKELGNVSLDNLDKSSPQLNEIRSYQPPALINNFYQSRVSLPLKASVKVGNTYAVRLMHFSDGTYKRFRRNDRTDRLLVLQIIRQESDQSLTVIWKEIEKRKTSKLRK